MATVNGEKEANFLFGALIYFTEGLRVREAKTKEKFRTCKAIASPRRQSRGIVKSFG